MRRTPYASLVLALAVVAGEVAAQRPGSDPPAPRPGEVTERIASAADPTQSWAVYVPSTYDPARSWPVLFVMDPRGRALLPLERLIEPAERWGYIVMSSYNTASDFMGADPNEPALSAMLDDAQTRFALDGRRLYLVGFSGTARAAWSLGMRLTGHLAGIIGVGGGMQQAMYEADLAPLGEHPELGFYGLVGTRDFNFDEMGTLEALLDRSGIANELSWFDGGHTWAPAELLARAVAWMETRAMKTGLAPVDSAVLNSIHHEWVGEARSLEAAGDTVAAWRAYRSVADLFGGLRDVGQAERDAARLGDTRAVVEGVARAGELRDRYWEAVDRFGALLWDVQIGARRPDADRLASEIGLAGLLAEAADTTDPLGADASARILEHVFSHAAFYQPRIFVGQGRTGHALALLELAERIFPERPNVCRSRAGVLASAGREAEALEAVRCAVEKGLPREILRNDPALDPLRGLPAFRTLSGGD